MRRGEPDPRRRAHGELEAEVLAALWASPTPLVPADVLTALGGAGAYNTVQTILIRLLEKGVVTRKRVGRAHAYAPVLGQAEAAAHRMHEVMDRDADHAAVLQRFVEGLSPADEAALRALITPTPPAGTTPDGPVPGGTGV